jgi:nicotinamidase-related amidase
MSTKLVPSKAVLLFLDLQVVHAKMLPGSIDKVLDNAASTIKIAREKGIVVAHCRMAFNDEQSANLPASNPLFARLAQDPSRLAVMHVNSPESAFHEKVAPEKGDIVFCKNRVGPFRGKGDDDFQAILTERGIDTIIMGGVATGGAVLATVVQATDLDYRLVVLEDCCEDADEEVHRVLIGKIFPKRAQVIKSDDFEGLFEE